MNVCKKCNIEKKENDFYDSKNRNGTYRKNSYCKECFSVIAKQKYAKKKKELLSYKVPDLIEEKWAAINGWEGLYEVSNLGRVKRLQRIIQEPQWNREKLMPERLMTPTDNGEGYMQVRLSLNDRVKTAKVHILVASAFIPNPDNKPEVNHLFGNKWDNRVSVLEWTTRQENINHKYSVLKYKHPTDTLPSCKPVIMVDSLGVETTFPSASSAARKISGDFRNVSAGALGIRKTYKGFKFKYAV